MHTFALHAPTSGSPLVATTIDRRELRDDDVDIRVEYCGVCHSDLSMLDNEWGISNRMADTAVAMAKLI